MKKNLIPPLCTLILMALTGCYIEEPVQNDQQQVGYRPVYGSPEDSKISFVPSAQTIENPGKIYIYNKYLLVNEQKKGIHVFDNSKPEAPVNLGFLKILGNSDMVIKDGLLYVDHLGNLVSLSVADFNTIEEKGRLPLHNWSLGVPPPAGFGFECVDPQKGIAVSWTKIQGTNFQCYAVQ